MKFVTYNIRTEAQVDGVNRFYFRRGLILDKIEKEQPDIIGFQEMRHDMHTYMRPHLNSLGYTLIGCGRGEDYKGEHNPVAFKSDKYDLLELDVSWLSPTPEVPGSRFEKQSSCPRIITHMILKDFDEDTPFHVYNTHLDHQEAEARVKGAKRLMEKISADLAAKPLPLVLCGDFNAYPDSEEAKYIMRHPLGLNELTKGIGTTWHDWGRKSDPQIDYIFVKGFAMNGEVAKWDDNLNGVYLSDHYPLAVEINMDKEGK